MNAPFQVRPAAYSVIAATERGTVAVPHDELFDERGSLRFIAEALDRGLIQLSQGAHGIQLRIGGVVGRLPLTERLVLDVSPKFPIANLARLLALSDESLDRRMNVERLYDFTAWSGYLPELLLRNFALALEGVASEGLHRSYSRKIEEAAPRPKIHFWRSEQRFWSRGVPTKAVVETFEFDADNAVNRILKTALLCSLGLSKGVATLQTERRTFASALGGLTKTGTVPAQQIDHLFARGFSQVPTFKPYHARALLIAREIIKRSTAVLEFADQKLSLPSFLIILDDVFESYIRNIVRNKLGIHNRRIRVYDGNLKDHQKPLLSDSDRFIVKPDVLIYSDGGGLVPQMVCDIKYKAKPGEDDRYQIITHTLSFKSRTAMLVYPKREGGPSGLVRLGRLGPAEHMINLFEFHYDLSADLEEEEERIGKALAQLL